MKKLLPTMLVTTALASPTLSVASGLPVYEADGGLLSYGVRGSVVVPVTSRVSEIGFGSVNRLADEVSDSSLVSTRGSNNQTSAGIVLNVTF